VKIGKILTLHAKIITKIFAGEQQCRCFSRAFFQPISFFVLFGYLYIERLNCATDLTTLSGNFRVVEP